MKAKLRNDVKQICEKKSVSVCELQRIFIHQCLVKTVIHNEERSLKGVSIIEEDTAKEREI